MRKVRLEMKEENTEKTYESIETTLVNLLIDGGYHISFAESCTAGLAVGRLVNVADASKVLDVSFV
ncbi:MAG: CinA family protein, partial [Eubacterium sp.]|nr:CinA family protein [Eubacterium sp.]